MNKTIGPVRGFCESSYENVKLKKQTCIKPKTDVSTHPLFS